MRQVRRLGPRIGQDAAAQRVAGARPQHLVAQRVEDRFAGMEPDARGVARRPADAQAAARLGRMAVEGAEQRIERAAASWREGEVAVEVAADRQAEPPGAGLHEPPHVGRKQLQIAFAVEVAAQRVEAFGHVAGPPVDPRVGLLDAGHPPRGQRGLQALADPPFAVAGQRVEQVVAERAVLEQPSDDVEDLVRAEFPADRVQLVEQHLQHAALAGAGGDQVDDHHVAPLAVAVDAPQALLETRRVPGDVVVDHQPAELQVDPLAGRVGGDEEAVAAGPAEAVDLRLARRPRHAPVDRGDPARVADALEPPDQVLDRVAVLAEDEPLVAGVARVVEHRAEPFELRLGAGVDQAAGPGAQRLDGGELLAQLVDRHRGHRAEDSLFVLRGAPGVGLVAGVAGVGQGIEDVAFVGVAERVPPGTEIRRRETPGGQIFEGAAELRGAPVERAAERPGGAGEPPLKDAEGEAGRGTGVERAAVRPAQPVRGPVVQRLLAVRSRRQAVAERGAGAPRVERPAREVDHLLLGPAEEVARPRRGRETAERLFRAEGVRVEQAPEVMPGRVLAHVRRGGQQQQVARAPAQAGEAALGAGATGQRLGEPVAAGLAGAPPLPGGGQLVRLVEDRQIVGGDAGAPQPVERRAAGQRVERDDDQVAVRPAERVAGAGVGAGDDAEAEPEQRPQLPLPVADQTGGRRDDHPFDPSAQEHLAHGEAGHDGLAGARVVGEQEAERVLPEHPLVDRDALVRQRVDAGRLAGEGRVALVTVGQMQRLGDGQDGVCAAGEVERRRRSVGRGRGSRRRVRPARRPRGGFFLQGAESGRAGVAADHAVGYRDTERVSAVVNRRGNGESSFPRRLR